jgi:hypothetical protein
MLRDVFVAGLAAPGGVVEGLELGQQYWTRSDGTGRRWLAVQYEYTRRR